MPRRFTPGRHDHSPFRTLDLSRRVDQHGRQAVGEVGPGVSGPIADAGCEVREALRQFRQEAALEVLGAVEQVGIAAEQRAGREPLLVAIVPISGMIIPKKGILQAIRPAKFSSGQNI